MQDTIDAVCERCHQPMPWDTNALRVCIHCRLAACGLDPDQLEKTSGIAVEPLVAADPPDEEAWHALMIAVREVA